MANATGKITEIGLVLQGGGALGAYEYGAITALLELIDEAIGKGRSVMLKAVSKQLDKTERTIIEPHHVLASGSLPPQFPWTDIKDGTVRHYWDGGIIDNTPLTDAIDAFSLGPDINRILVVMNLFPQMSRLPSSFFEVTERVDELRFGNCVHQDVRAADRINMLATTIDELAKLVPGVLAPDLATNVAKARAMKLVNTVELTLEPASRPEDADAYAFRDFSRDGIGIRKAAGRALALETLRPKFDE